jgi:hypothetical protein
MRPIITILLFLKLGLVIGQPVNYFVPSGINLFPPEIIKVGKTISRFVPYGWTIVDSTIGDLNGDHKLDIAFVIKSKDSIKTYSFNEFEGEERVNRIKEEKYPRNILIVAFCDSTKDCFNLIEQSYSMIPSINGLNTKIEIENNLLKIEISSINSDYNYSSISNYYFSYQNEQLLLTKFNRNKLEKIWTEYCVIDFIGKKMGLAKGKVNVEKPDTIWINIENIIPRTMKVFKPFSWYIAEGVSI